MKTSMKTYIVRFKRRNNKMGKRTIKARNRDEAVAKCTKQVGDSFWHYIIVSEVNNEKRSC